MASIVPVGKRFRALIARRGVRVSRTFDTRSEANAWAARREHEILTGTSPAQIDARLTLHKVFTRFRDEDAQKRRGCRWEVTRLNRFLREFEDIPLTKLGAGNISAWRNAREKSVSDGSVRRDMSLLKTVLETARRDWGWLPTNPMADVKKPPAPPSRKRLISDEERDAVVAALNYAEDLPPVLVTQRVAVAFLIALETGMRAGELRKCKVVGKVALLQDGERKGDATKNRDEREVPLSLRARELFAKIEGKVDVSAGSLDALFRKARNRAGLKGFVFHDSRHTACTKLAQKLKPLDLAKMLGHRDLRSTLVYYNPRGEDLADLLD